MSHEIKPLGETGYMLIRETYITRSTVKAVKTTTITFDDGYSRTEEEEVEVSRDTVCHYEDIYLFNQNQYDTMVRNYELGGCPITEKVYADTPLLMVAALTGMDSRDGGLGSLLRKGFRYLKSFTG